jgi:hypothetical protein
MTNVQRLLVAGAVLGSATFVQAGERSLLARLQGPSLFQQTQAVQVPTPDPQFSPQPQPLGAPSPYDGPQGYSYPAPAPYGAYPAPAPAPYGAYPAPHGPGEPGFAPYGYPVNAGPAPRVKVEDRDNIHPCAVERVVLVPDPCGGCDACLVPITICVPPCACEDHCCKKDGRHQKFDYGKYEVEICVKDGYVEVDYDD